MPRNVSAEHFHVIRARDVTATCLWTGARDRNAQVVQLPYQLYIFPTNIS